MKRFLSLPSLLLLFVACSGAPPAHPEAVDVGSQAAPEIAFEVAAPEELRPARSVILITIDTLRADYLGAYGGPARTPNLDRLAAHGWRFEEAISASMLTNPSHASIMTSLYPRDHNVYDNETGISDGMTTLASHLRRDGMRTGAVINFPHLNPSTSNLGQGMERVVPGTRKERRAHETSEIALDIVDEFQGDAFFMWVHYTDPHSPYEPHADHPVRPDSVHGETPMAKARKAAPGFQRKNPWFQEALRKHGTVEALTRKYVAEIEATDAGLGLLFDGLQARNMTDVAIVVTSDHGENLGEHDLYFHHGGLFRETVHVPLIISSVGTQARVVTDQVATVDIAPTILELLGKPKWQPMRGQSLVDVAQGNARGRPYVFSEHMLAQQVAVRSATGTLILHRKSSKQFPTYPMRSGTADLYDLEADPYETRPLAADDELGRRLRAALDDYLGLGPTFSARRGSNIDRESLRALGYID